MSSQRSRTARLVAVGALGGLIAAPLTVLSASAAVDPATTAVVNLININDFHGRIDENTVKFAGTVEQLRAEYGEDSSVFLSAGDNIGASLFASSTQGDIPTIDVLNALDLATSAVGNHELDQGYDDLVGRVSDASDFSYLGANIYEKGTTTPAFPEYATFEVDGVTVGVIGALTQETPTLVSPGGITALDFGDPVEAVNRVAAQLSDGDDANGEADVIVAEYHEGAGAGTPDGATLDQEIAAGGAFASIVTDTSADVDAIFTGHTHKEYAWEYNGRPIVQTGSYGENIGQIVLNVDRESGEVSVEKYGNVARTTADDATLIDTYPRVAAVEPIVDAALDYAEEVGEQVIGSATADITTAFTDGTTRDDRASESTLGNFVADALLNTLSDESRGGADIGVVNPGGLRAELYAGDITYAEANAVLPFLNNLWVTTLTGEQVTTMLEQQWQTDADGNVPSRPYLQLGLSDNVTYTYDPGAARGAHITSVTIDGEPLDPSAEYTIGSFSFLLQGGDNFRVFTDGTNTRDTGLVDRDAWIDYIQTNSPISPSYDRRGVAVTGIPTGPVEAGSSFTLDVSKLDLTSLGVPAETELTAAIDGETIGTAAVSGGAASVEVQVADDASGDYTLTLTGTVSGTVVTIPLSVTAASTVPTKPSDDPVAAGDDELTDDLEGGISTDATVRAGDELTIRIGQGTDWAGQWVSVWLHSDPVLLGGDWLQVEADGTVTVTVPEDTALGEHRLVVQAADGSVIGWQSITVTAAAGTGTDDGDDAPAGTGTLPRTGAEASEMLPFAAGAVLLLLVGAAVLIIARRRAKQQ